MLIQGEKPPSELEFQPFQDLRWNAVPEGFICVSTMFQALSTLKAFCHLGLDNVLRSFGWKSVLDSSGDDQNQKGTSVQMSIQRYESHTAIPLQDLQNVLTTRLFIVVVNHKLQHHTSGIRVRVKLWDSVIWSGFVQSTTPTGVFADAWSFAAKYWGRKDQLRTIIKGQRTNPEWEFSHYLDPQLPTPEEVRIHLVMELHGGGSKADAVLKAEEDFAARVLQVGFDPLDSKQFVQQLYQEAGAARMRTLLNIPDEETFAQQCGILAKQTRIALPQRHDLDEARLKRIKSSWQAQQGQMSNLVADTLRIVPGTFCLHDGTEVPICDFRKEPLQGVLFSEPDEVAAVVRQHDKIHQAFMVIVPGPTCPLNHESCQRFHIPVLLPNESRVIITACCHSIGKNTVTVKLSDGDAAVVTETTKTMIVVWKHECPVETWDAMIAAPIHTIFKTMNVLPAQVISGPPFGRSWRAARQQVTPESAESFYFMQESSRRPSIH